MRVILVSFVSERLDIDTCQQNFYDPSRRTSVAMTAIGFVLTKPVSRQVKSAKIAVSLDKIVNLTWLDLSWLVWSWLGLSC